MVRALTSHQCGPGSNPGLSLSLVLSLAPGGFTSGTQGYPSPQKPTFLNSNLTRNQVNKEPQSGCAISKFLFILNSCFLAANVRKTEKNPPHLLSFPH